MILFQIPITSKPSVPVKDADGDGKIVVKIDTVVADSSTPIALSVDVTCGAGVLVRCSHIH